MRDPNEDQLREGEVRLVNDGKCLLINIEPFSDRYWVFQEVAKFLERLLNDI